MSNWSGNVYGALTTAGFRMAYGAAALMVVAAGVTAGVAALEQDAAAALDLDAPAEGALGRNGVEVWTFDGTAGTTVSVHVDASAFDPVAYLWSPAGELVGTADEGGPTLGMALDGPLVTDLLLSGRYRIEVRSADDDGRGDYAVAVRTVRKLPPNVPVAGGTDDVEGRSVSVEVWTFDGTAGYRVHVGCDTPVVSLRSPLGEQVVLDIDHSRGVDLTWRTAVLPSTGEYQIRVLDPESYEIMMRTSGGDSGAGEVDENAAAAGLPYAPELGRAWSATHGDENGWTDLHYAAALNRPDLARRLLDAGASIDARLVNDDYEFSERLKETLEAFNAERILWEVTADTRARIWDATPLDLAIFRDVSDVAELLLNRGANLAVEWSPHSPFMPKTPLGAAVHLGSVEMVELLLNRGANLEGRDDWGESYKHSISGTPLWIARSVKKAELLLDRGASLETRGQDGDTLLHEAARSGSSGMVELLLNRGMDIDAVNSDGVTPLLVAGLYRPGTLDQVYHDSEMVELLLDRGANLEFKAPDGDTLLHDVARRGGSEVMEVMELLLDRGANIEAVNGDGETPLWVAGTRRLFHHERTSLNREVLELLLDRGANLEHGDGNGETLLHHAAREGDPGKVGLLLNLGANADAVNGRGETPLDVATTSEVVDLLSNR